MAADKIPPRLVSSLHPAACQWAFQIYGRSEERFPPRSERAMTTYCRWGPRGTGGDEHPDGERASPEFTGKAVVIGLAIGCLLCFTNLYFGLQTGWISM